MEKRKAKWLLLSLPLAVLAICAAAWKAETVRLPMEQTTVSPPMETAVTFDMEKNRAYTAEDGVIVIGEVPEGGTPASLRLTDPERIWEPETRLSTETYTLPEEVRLDDGSIGTLEIPALYLTASVFETEDELESMTKGVAHFAGTSAWDGNVGLASHNVPPAGAAAFFRDIHLLKQGDVIVYTTAQGRRQYRVTAVEEIAQDDWSYLGRTEDNRITLITCITGKPELRLMVQATEGSFVGFGE